VLNKQPRKRLITLRIVAAFILASIAWGSTFEFTHNHEARSGKFVSTSEAANAPATVSDVQANGRRFQTNEPQRSSSRSKAGTDCLICQLHHNLSATLISRPPGVGATDTKAPNATSAVGLRLSEFTANQHGRAPPFNL
jgi:hypothetical protein